MVNRGFGPLGGPIGDSHLNFGVEKSSPPGVAWNLPRVTASTAAGQARLDTCRWRTLRGWAEHLLQVRPLEDLAVSPEAGAIELRECQPIQSPTARAAARIETSTCGLRASDDLVTERRW
jgi:hypothetical protein